MIGVQGVEKQKRFRETYQIMERVSEGNFGTVYKVKDVKTSHIYAMKKVMTSKKNRENTLREITVLSKISHENIIKIIDWEVKENAVNFVMEYCEMSLHKYLRDAVYPLSRQNVKTIANMILKGLHELHSQGFIHRDIKPSNVLIDSLGVVKIADFGLAINVSEKGEDGRFGIEGFTTWYKPPEVLMGSRSYDQSFDIWSFACVFGEMLNGAPLFPGSNDLHQVSKMSQYIGSPTEDNWPSVVDMPNYNKIHFEKRPPQVLEEIFMDASRSEVELLASMLKYDRRLTAEELLKSSYFKEYPPPLPKLLPEEKLEEVEIAKYEDIFKVDS